MNARRWSALGWTIPWLASAAVVGGCHDVASTPSTASATSDAVRGLAGHARPPSDPAVPKFTDGPLDVTWESVVFATDASDTENAEPRAQVKKGGRIRTGQPLRVFVRVPKTNRPLERVRLTLDGAACSTRRTDDDGFAFVGLCGIDIDRDPGTAPLVLTAQAKGTPAPDVTDVKREWPLQVIAGTYDERSLTVKKKYVEPPKRVRKRIARERETIQAALSSDRDDATWPLAFTRPVDTKETSPFGTLRTYNGERESRHLGLDLDGKTGDPIVAIGAGTVVLVEQRYFSGGTVVVDHGQSLFSLYFHMSRFDVAVGDVVGAGTLLGAVGKSGRVTGPHLHLSVKIGGHYIDPKTLLAFTAPALPATALAAPKPDR